MLSDHESHRSGRESHKSGRESHKSGGRSSQGGESHRRVRLRKPTRPQVPATPDRIDKKDDEFSGSDDERTGQSCKFLCGAISGETVCPIKGPPHVLHFKRRLRNDEVCERVFLACYSHKIDRQLLQKSISKNKHVQSKFMQRRQTYIDGRKAPGGRNWKRTAGVKKVSLKKKTKYEWELADPSDLFYTVPLDCHYNIDNIHCHSHGPRHH